MPDDVLNADIEDMHPRIPAVLGLTLLFILAAISVPYGLCALICQSVAEYRLRKKMTAAGRFTPWICLLDKLTAGHGTLIVEQAQKRGHRIGWTPDSVRSTSPPDLAISPSWGCVEAGTAAPFVSWCFNQYCSPTTGRGILTQCPISFPAGFIEYDWLIARFPGLDVVVTVMQK